MQIIDTNILMSYEYLNKILELDAPTIPHEVLQELDNLKTKDGDKGFNARKAIRTIEENKDKLSFISQKRFNGHNDDAILNYFKKYKKAVLYTNDISMRLKAESRNITVEILKPNKNIKNSILVEENNDYTINNILKNSWYGLDDYLFSKLENADFNYLLIGNSLFSIADEIKPIKNLKIGNKYFTVEGLDPYQDSAINSLYNDDLTIITGLPGSGKTLLSMAYCLQRMQKGFKTHIFINPVKVRGSEDLGAYPGNRDEKLLQNFIGDLLKTKIGDSIEVFRLMDEGKLNIYPFSDIRGIEISPGDIMYITEAQNLSVDMIKLAVQRCSEGSKIIIEGDPSTQVDKLEFSADNNGLKRLIDVFVGEDKVSHINLQNIYRSRIANLAEKM